VKRHPASSQITVIEWPANSPDLSPIENIWAYLKYRLDQYEEPPKTIDQLWERVQDIWTTIPIDLLDELCSCPDHTKHRIPCKHMYLVTRIYPDIVPERRLGPIHINPGPTQEKVNIDDQFGLPLENYLSPHLLNQLEAERTKESERKKREREEATAQATRDCEKELEDTWKRMGRFIYGTGKRRCTLKDKQDALAAMKEAVAKVGERD
jgi:hypothetical protein